MTAARRGARRSFEPSSAGDVPCARRGRSRPAQPLLRPRYSRSLRWDDALRPADPEDGSRPVALCAGGTEERPAVGIDPDQQTAPTAGWLPAAALRLTRRLAGDDPGLQFVRFVAAGAVANLLYGALFLLL